MKAKIQVVACFNQQTLLRYRSAMELLLVPAGTASPNLTRSTPDALAIDR